MKMTKLLTLVLLGLTLSTGIAQKPISIGTEHSIQSNVLNEDRTILIHTPEMYDEYENKRYPVLYLLDGWSHFNHTVTMIDYVSSRFPQFPEMIVIGIPSMSNQQRRRDLIPEKTAFYPNGGEADNFIEFFEQELFSYIDSNYRTTSYKTIIGHSFGGLFTAYYLTKHPDRFQGVHCYAGGYFKEKFSFLENFQSFLQSSDTLDVFLSAGVGSGERPEILNGNLAFERILIENPVPGLNWNFQVFDSTHTHLSLVHEAIYNGLRKQFSDYAINRKFMMTASYEDIVKHFKFQANKLDNKQPYNEFILIELADHFAFILNKKEDAIKLLRLNLEYYPNSQVSQQLLDVINEQN